MTAPVVSLAERRAVVDEGIVRLLEDHLERARAGETASIAIASTTRDGYGQTSWSAGPGVLLLGAVTLLGTRIGIAMDADMEDAPPVA